MDKISNKNSKLNLNGNNKVSQNKTPLKPNQPKNQIKYSETEIKTSTRLNALDSTLLENNAYKDMDNNDFKTEYKIDKLETELKSVYEQLSMAKTLNDTTKEDMLNMKKHSIESELQELYSEYEGVDISKKITNGISSMMKPKTNIFTKITDTIAGFISDNILSHISQRFSSNKTLKVALNKLETINNNVNELVSTQTPYGEANEKYSRITQYLTKANTIQYNVSKDLSGKKNKIKKNPFEDLTSKEVSEAMEKKTKKANAKKDTAQKNALNLNNNLK